MSISSLPCGDILAIITKEQLMHLDRFCVVVGRDIRKDYILLPWI
jgi:hypothetical protein